MPGVALTPRQEELKREIETFLDQLIRWAEHPQDEVTAWLERLSEIAFQLHEELKGEGQEPEYPIHVLAKRGMRPTSKEFYRNMYGAEALLRFTAEGSPARRNS